MANIDRIVNVQISLNTTAIKEKSFSDLLVLGPHAMSVTRILVVTDSDQLLDNGMASTDPIYMAVRDAFKQIPTLNQVFVGRQQVDEVDLTVTKATASVYSTILSWRAADGAVVTSTASYTGKPTDTTDLIAAGLVSAITALGSPVTAEATGAAIKLTATVSGTPFGVAAQGNIEAALPTSDESPTDALAACRKENDDWYGVVLADRSVADDVIDAAQWIEANEKLLGVATADPATLDGGQTSDIAARLQQMQMFRTHVWFHRPVDTEWLEAAITANRFTYYPGGETWANCRLAGISYDTLAEGESIAARAKNANTFEPFRNFAITQNGKVAAGEWIDVIRFRDWLAESIKVNVVSAMINADGKIPYTDPGIQVITTAMRQSLDLGVSRKGIAPEEVDADGRKIPSYTIDAPLAADVPFNDKANRILRDVKFTARLAGAIHVVEIKGNLTYAM